MSSSKNNNLPTPIITATSQPEGRQVAVGPARPQRSVTEQSVSSHRRQSDRRGRGRGRQDGFFVRADRSNRTADRALDGDNVNNDEVSSSLADNVPANSNGSVRGYRPGRGGGVGKYKQRNHTNQLIDGLSSYEALDIDLAERLVPTSHVQGEPGRGRHSASGRKVNLTHLLNYKSDSKRLNKHSNQNDSSSMRNRGNSSHYRDPGTFHKFSKQQFLQANCQFVVLEGHDYSVHKADPDWPVDWDCIEEVRFKLSACTETTCPICLEFPVAAKITRCGHIYCWTCMLHYLSLSDENCRQCPICGEAVYRGDLRSVVSHSYTNHSVDEDIVLTLMIREKGCVEVQPYRSNELMEGDLEPGDVLVANRDKYCSQAKLVIVDPATVVSKIVQREQNELLVKLELDKHEPEVCFVEQALSYLQKRLEKLPAIGLQYGSSEEPGKGRPRQRHLSYNSDLTKSYLFYQCSDGQHIYLNPFSTKILCHEYSSLENCPVTINAKILQMDWISMSEAWRKRFRYLEHLPLTCEFRLIEIDFSKSNLISPSTYKVFETQIQRREQEREKRRRDERKREKIIQVEQNRRIYGIQPSLKINLDSFDQFPSVSDERYLGLSLPRNQSRSDQDYLSDEEEDLDSVQVDEARGGSSRPLDTGEVGPSGGTNAQSTQSITEQVSEVALSFRDIQLQEAAKEAKSTTNQSSNVSGAWTAQKGKGSSNAPQSSFAQLVQNAKTSQRGWTRNVTSAPKANNPSFPTLSSSSTKRVDQDSDEGGEELRAPPTEFTISDFIDMNVVSKTKKKGKPKGISKKN